MGGCEDGAEGGCGPWETGRIEGKGQTGSQHDVRIYVEGRAENRTPVHGGPELGERSKAETEFSPVEMAAATTACLVGLGDAQP